jgi:hypothetical protein
VRERRSRFGRSRLTPAENDFIEAEWQLILSGASAVDAPCRLRTPASEIQNNTEQVAATGINEGMPCLFHLNRFA